MQKKPLPTPLSKNFWVHRHSESFPGHSYCFNTATGESMWCRNEDTPNVSSASTNIIEDNSTYPEPYGPPPNINPSTNPPTFVNAAVQPTYPNYHTDHTANILVSSKPTYLPQWHPRVDRTTQTSRNSSPAFVETTQVPITRRVSGHFNIVRTINHEDRQNSYSTQTNRVAFAPIWAKTKSTSIQTVDADVDTVFSVLRKRSMLNDSEIMNKYEEDGPKAKFGKTMKSYTDLSGIGCVELDNIDEAKKQGTTDKVMPRPTSAPKSQKEEPTTSTAQTQKKVCPEETPSLTYLAVDDLRFKLLARRRKTSGSAVAVTQTSTEKVKTSTSREDTPPPKPAQPTAAKKRVTFDLDNTREAEPATPSASETFFEDREGTFADQHTSSEDQRAYNTAKLRGLTGTYEPGQCWYIAADLEVLLHDVGFIEDLVRSDKHCRLMIPTVVRTGLATLCMRLCAGRETTRVLVARRLTRQLATCDFVVYEENSSSSNKVDDIIDCCKRNNVILITNQGLLLTKAFLSQVTCLTLEEVKKIVTKKDPVLFETKTRDIHQLETTPNLLQTKQCQTTTNPTQKQQDETRQNESKKIKRTVKNHLATKENTVATQDTPTKTRENIQTTPNVLLKHRQTTSNPNQKEQDEIRQNETKKIKRTVKNHLAIKENTVATQDTPTKTTEIYNVETTTNVLLPKQCQTTPNPTEKEQDETRQNESKKIKRAVKNHLATKENTDVNATKTKETNARTIQQPKSSKATQKELKETQDISRQNASSQLTMASNTTNMSSELNWGVQVLDLRDKSPILGKKTLTDPPNVWSPSLLSENFWRRDPRQPNNTPEKAVDKLEHSLEKVADKFEQELQKVSVMDMADEEKILARNEEWLCRFVQVLEEALPCVVNTKQDLAFQLDEALTTIKARYANVEECTAQSVRLACDEIEDLFVRPLYPSQKGVFVRIKPDLGSKKLMKILGSGNILIKSLMKLHPATEALNAAEQRLNRLLDDARDPSSSPDVALCDFKETIEYKSVPEDVCMDDRHKMKKQSSEVVEYLRRHYPAWQGCELKGTKPATLASDVPVNEEAKPKGTVKIVRTLGRDLSKVKLTSRTTFTLEPACVDDDSGLCQSDEPHYASSLIDTFLRENCDVLIFVYDFVKSTITELEVGTLQKDRKRVIVRKANRIQRFLDAIKDKLRRIIEREASESENTLKMLIKKSGVTASNVKMTQYRQIVMKLLEQVNVLYGCLNTIVKLENGAKIDVNLDQVCDIIEYINIFDMS